jgi:predicted phosphodiesterase
LSKRGQQSVKRSYTNKQGDKVIVSEEHLETAIKIKLELQKMSPSRKASWNRLVNMMEIEGFYDAENNESYRCMIKAHQKTIGELPQVAKYAELVSESKLKSIKELVGEMSYEKRENQQVLTQINKGKRELIDFALITEQIGQAFKDHDWSEFELSVEPKTSKSGKKMIVALTDLHIGALVNTDVNTYNYEVAKQRISEYAEKVISKANYNYISDIHIVNLGDVIEHSNMRYGQAFNAEFVYSEQLVRASDLIIKFIKAIAEEGFKITYAGFAGNHDRTNDKDKNIDGDHAQRPINHAIKIFIENANIGDVTYVQAKDYSHRLLDINGRNFKFLHGDLDSYKDESLVGKHSAMDGVEYDLVIMGHFHHFREIEVGIDKRIVMFGSLKGSDEYSEKIRRMSVASQGMIIVDAGGEVEVKRVKLN